MSDSWQVHVMGPDDLIPARSQREAINLAHRINRQIHSAANFDGINEHTPYAWAVPVPPGNTAAIVRKA
jgi:hypothetical protein